MNILNKIIASLSLMTVIIVCAYFSTEVTVVTIKPEDVRENYPFHGKVVLKNNQSYLIGTAAACDIWINKETIEYSYRWFQ
jgi:hypothetical protein